ncbi:MAG: hypothetical protein IM653_09685 [Phenylobacterium sp.]|uniref:hypothetical protein n=1 Tax=Phenylobacterium sp. TaxID=1871053 RepID=UPI0025E9CD2D|nr:hypothetical protein [Phenylobacterium sp.]MCA6230742.1 hypothetical protein [Phenylobacterium sp.]MCA6235392.1 hypothetical protein [Phenylobacterium sp.]MCA6250564.1 hypothetical protein [Phenylobacterium sp.]MCA6258230.1 hypothetical protein [Phenylobacterium sp.]MCA6266261.1 hypothetical protein [Phenylobacterium sp.]
MTDSPLRILARRVRSRLPGLAARARATVRTPDEALVADAMDPDWYRAMNPDVAASGADPADHFLRHGWREGRDPLAAFSVRDYLELYPDVAAAGINPFLHWLKAGQAEGRLPRRDVGRTARAAALLESLKVRLDRAAARWPRVRPSSRDDLVRRLAALGPALADLHLTVSHDDAFRNVGGLQLCVQREHAAFAAQGVGVLHLYPVDTWPTLREDGGGPVGVSVAGEAWGAWTAQDVGAALAAALPPSGRRTFALHSLLGHDPAAVEAILRAGGFARGVFWLHDFASLCAGIHLMRDDLVDCGAPPAASAACGVCVYGPRRGLHADAHRRLIEAFGLQVLAPSQVALDLWRRASGMSLAPAQVLPLAALGGPAASAPGPPAPDGVLRVAFLGAPVPHKGWDVFCDVVGRFADDPRYAFLQFGAQGAGYSGMRFVEVRVSTASPQAMRDALVREGVDVALAWSLCTETFGFTALEAAAAGAAVLAGPDSGNIAAQVRAGLPGLVLDDEAALFAAFESGAVLALSRSARGGAVRDIDFSGLTASPGVRPGP